MHAFLIAALVAASLLQISSPAQGQQMIYECDDHTSMAARLMTVYGEQNIWRGTTHDGKMVEVYVSEGGDSWSVLVVQPTGVACLAANGTGWQTFPLKRPGKGA